MQRSSLSITSFRSVVLLFDSRTSESCCLRSLSSSSLIVAGATFGCSFCVCCDFLRFLTSYLRQRRSLSSPSFRSVALLFASSSSETFCLSSLSSSSLIAGNGTDLSTSLGRFSLCSPGHSTFYFLGVGIEVLSQPFHLQPEGQKRFV